MAVKASFEADFSKWLDGIRAVNGSLDQLQAVVGTTDRSVDAMSKRFDGTKVIGEATKMVSAVQDIGGAARLTDSEARRVNATVTEAIDKMQRLGGTAPPEMLKLRDATSRANNELKQQPGIMENIKGAAMSAGKMLAGAFTVGAISTWAMKAIDAAGRIDDLSKKLGVSTDAVQRWSHAATMGGSSIEDVDKAVAFMNKTLAGGSGSTVKALSDAGLKFDEIRKMRPEDAFETIAEAIGQIEDPMMRARVAMMLFGKSGQELLPALSDGFVRVGNEADKMSGDTIETLAKAGDEIDKWSNRLTIALGEFLATISRQYEATVGLTVKAVDVLLNLDDDVSKSTDGLVKGLSNQKAAIAGLIPVLPDASAATAAWTAEEKRLEQQLTKSKAAQEAYNASVRQMADQYTGKKIDEEIKKITDAIRVAGGVSKITAEEQEKLGKQLSDLRVHGGLLPPELMKLAIAYEDSNRKALPVVSTLKSIDDAMKAVYATAMSSPPESLIVTPLVTSIQTALKAVQQHALQAAPPVALSFSSRFGEMMGTQLPQAIMGAIQGGGSVIEAAGSTIGSFLVSDKGIGKSLAAGAKDLFGNKLGGMIASALPGLGAMLGPALSGLFNKLFGSAGRDAVKEFASTFGGFDALREKLNALGAEGERLWVQLTQGTGKNNKAQAEAAIRAIQEAFARAEEEARKLREEIAGIESELADLRSRSEPTFRDMEAAAKAFGVELSRLGPAFQQQRLTERAREIYDAFDTLRRGGADTTDILEGMADEINDLVLQSLQFGTTIPENFRPLIESLIETGQLLDHKGNKLTSLGDIKFGDPIKSQWEQIGEKINQLTDALQALVNKLNGPVVQAAENVAREFGNLPGEIDVRLRVGRPGDAEGDELPQFATGTKGVTGRYFQNFGAGKLAMLHGNEAVVPQAQAQQFADAVGGGNGDVVAELSALRSDFVAMPRLIARAVRDAILVAG